MTQICSYSLFSFPIMSRSALLSSLPPRSSLSIRMPMTDQIVWGPVPASSRDRNSAHRRASVLPLVGVDVNVLQPNMGMPHPERLEEM